MLYKINKKLILISILLNVALNSNYVRSAVAPILDIENEQIGYVGTIGERNILVDLKPHLSIKNLDSINGICSYHVFKPNNEEFPFTIDIKDKLTGEAIIELIHKDADENEKRAASLDCNKRKFYDFLIQAHDCSNPSLASNKVPVKIEVLDHDDSKLKFEKDTYAAILVESNDLYENFVSVRARDQDCTNDGYACSYKLLNKYLEEADPSTMAFKIDPVTGLLSSTRALRPTEKYELNVRAFDCVSKDSFVDTKVMIQVVEKCTPQWVDFPSNILAMGENNKIFDGVIVKSCDEQNKNVHMKPSDQCQVESVSSKVTLSLDADLKALCQTEKCEKVLNNNVNKAETVQTIYSGGVLLQQNKAKSSIDNANDDIDDDESAEETETIIGNNDEANNSNNKVEPTSFSSFSKSIENAQKVDFDGSFGDNFVLSAWLRRPAGADKTTKEQVFCGTDSKSMNRHHFGLYFYRGNLKFLMRKEPVKDENTVAQPSDAASSSSETFYPSLWEWTIYEPILSDAKWHFYEIKFNYPNASLYIDGKHFVENTTNSDIIDAYKLNEASETGEITTYVGACYHARTSSLVDHFEGDVGSILLRKQAKATLTKEQETKCKIVCNEYIESSDASMTESSDSFEISLKASNLNDMSQALKKVTYVNKMTSPKDGSRSIKVSTSVQCSNGQKQELKDVLVSISMNQLKKYNVRLEGDKKLFVSKEDLENGLEPFKEISITKVLEENESGDAEEDATSSNEDNIDSQSAESDTLSAAAAANGDDQQEQEQAKIKLSKCQIKIYPERNLLAPSLNNEKVMFLQNLLDEFGLKFEENLNQVTISGEQTTENYETFIRRLTYVVIYINDVEPEKLKLIATKKFLISCVRSESNVETNSILVQLNMTKPEDPKMLVKQVKDPNYVALKQVQKYVIDDEDIIQQKSDEFNLGGSTADASNPLVIALIVMASCGIGFMLVFGAIRIYTSNMFNNGMKRKQVPNEENPPLEWDDSGLNITENPLETLESGKCSHDHAHLQFEGDEYSDSEDELEGDDDDYLEEEEEEEHLNGQYYPDEDSSSVKIGNRDLEWDDTSLDVKLKHGAAKSGDQCNITSNKLTSSFIDPNQFV